MKQTPEVRLQKIEAAQKRWRSKLTRATNMLTKLHRQEDRLRKAIANQPQQRSITLAELPNTEIGKANAASWDVVTKPKPKPTITESCNDIASAMIQGKSFEQADTDLAIPGFLARKKLNPVAAQIASEQEETKRLKARGRIAKMKAKQSGETRRMPLQGRAALEAIRAG